MSLLKLYSESPPIRISDDGTPYIGDTKVLLPVFLNAYLDWGWSAEQLAEQFPAVSLADAHAVLAYYLNHRDELDVLLDEWNAEGRQVRDEWLTSSAGQQIRAAIRKARLSQVKP